MRRGDPRSRQQRLGLWLLYPDADARRTGFRHHGGDDGRADVVQYHPGSGHVYPVFGHRLGLIAALLIANVMLLVMNIPLIGLFTVC